MTKAAENRELLSYIRISRLRSHTRHFDKCGCNLTYKETDDGYSVTVKPKTSIA